MQLNYENFGILVFDCNGYGNRNSRKVSKENLSGFCTAEGILGTQTAKNGTGQGFALCRRMIEQMSGELTLQSEIDHGSFLQVFLREIRYSHQDRTALHALAKQNDSYFQLITSPPCPSGGRCPYEADFNWNKLILCRMLEVMISVTRSRLGFSTTLQAVQFLRGTANWDDLFFFGRLRRSKINTFHVHCLFCLH